MLLSLRLSLSCVGGPAARGLCRDDLRHECPVASYEQRDSDSMRTPRPLPP
jgi:hypothetical protein